MQDEHPINAIVENQNKADIHKEYLKYSKDTQHENHILQDYYAKYSLEIVKPHQFQSQFKFSPTSTMAPHRQLQYLNGIEPNNPIPLSNLKDWLKEAEQHKHSLIKRKRNTGLFLGEDTFVYAYHSALKKMYIEFKGQNSEDNAVDLKMRTVNSVEHGGEILELMHFGNQQALLSRQLYRLEVYEDEQIRYKYLSDHEITNTTVNPFFSKEVAFTTVDDSQFLVQLMQPGQEVSFSHRHSDNIKALQYMSCQSVVLATQSKIEILDQRAKVAAGFYSVNNKAERRILDLVWIRTDTRETPYFVVGSSTYVEVFDIRNSKSSIFETKHRCQESPPINYQIFMSNYSPCDTHTLLARKNLSTNKILVLGSSPNFQGSSLFLPFEPEQNLTSVSYERYMAGLFSGKRMFPHNSPIRMLFNYSLFNTGESQASVIPFLNNKHLYLIHAGSHGSLTLECFENDADMRPVQLGTQAKEDPVVAQLRMRADEAYLEEFAVKKEENEQIFQHKKNYSVYRNIADSDLKYFTDTLFEKAKNSPLSFEFSVRLPSGQPAPPPLIPPLGGAQISSQLIAQLQEEW